METRVENGEEEEWRVVLVYEEGDNSATAMVAETKNSSEREIFGERERMRRRKKKEERRCGFRKRKKRGEGEGEVVNWCWREMKERE